MGALAEAALLPDAEHSLALPRDRWPVAASAGEAAGSPQAALLVGVADLPLEWRVAVLPASLCEHWAQRLGAVQKKQAELAAVSPLRLAGS